MRTCCLHQLFAIAMDFMLLISGFQLETAPLSCKFGREFACMLDQGVRVLSLVIHESLDSLVRRTHLYL